MTKWLKTFAAWALPTFLVTVVAQYAQVSDAINAGDWDSAKKFGLAAILAGITGALGSVLTHLTSLVGDPATNRDVK